MFSAQCRVADAGTGTRWALLGLYEHRSQNKQGRRSVASFYDSILLQVVHVTPAEVGSDRYRSKARRAYATADDLRAAVPAACSTPWSAAAKQGL
jgi:hypothetical protein